jgi:hypothetical protein
MKAVTSFVVNLSLVLCNLLLRRKLLFDMVVYRLLGKVHNIAPQFLIVHFERIVFIIFSLWYYKPVYRIRNFCIAWIGSNQAIRNAMRLQRNKSSNTPWLTGNVNVRFRWMGAMVVVSL